MSNLCLLVEAGIGVLLDAQSEPIPVRPTWEVNLIADDLDLSLLTANARFAIVNGYDESRNGYVTNFYYWEHQVSDNNSIEIVDIDDERILLRLYGDTDDVDTRNGSKPPTRLSLETWFVHDSQALRSMQ